MFFIILGLVFIMLFSAYKATKKTPNIKLDDSVGLDGYISNLKEAIEILELRSKAGMEDAEAKLARFKENLKKAELFKNKTKDL